MSMIAVSRQPSESRAPRAPEEDDTFSVLAHDMRSALAVVRGFALTLRTRWDRMEATQIATSLDTIAERSEVLARFTDELVDAARAETGRLDLSPIDIDLAAILPDAVERARSRHPGRRFALELLTKPLKVLADPRRVDQVLDSLLSSASAAAPAGAEVLVEAGTAAWGTEGRGILIEVRHPLGNPEPSPFGAPEQHSPDAVLPEFGLHLSRLVVEAHGGRLWQEQRDGAAALRLFLPRR